MPAGVIVVLRGPDVALLAGYDGKRQDQPPVKMLLNLNVIKIFIRPHSPNLSNISSTPLQ
jgi:hypothetical protein